MTCGLNLEIELEALRRLTQTRTAEGGVAIDDAIHLGVAMLPVLPEGEMRAALRAVLLELGWREVDGQLSREFGGAVARLAADGASVSLRVIRAEAVSATAKVIASEGGEDAAAREAERQAGERLRTEEDAARARLRQEAVDEIARQEPVLRAAVQDALNRTYRVALEARARAMGEVESIVERGGEGGAYEVTVVVKA